MPRSFRSYLGALFEPPSEPEEPSGDTEVVVRPAAPPDYIATSDVLETFWSSVPPEFVSSVYKDAQRVAPARAAPPPPPPLPTDPEAVARELGLSDAMPVAELDRLRRAFAFGNHPDRVSQDMRDRAIVRMQIANQLIDEAKQRLAVRLSQARAG